MCLRTIAKWVSWIDIWLVINERIQTALLEIAGQQGNFVAESREAKVRDGAIDTFTETVGKKMQPTDKVELINYLNLSAIVGQLVSSPALSERRNGTWDGEEGLITDVVARSESDLSGMDAYLCGPPPMVDAALAMLDAEGVPEDRVFYDKFTTTAPE